MFAVVVERYSLLPAGNVIAARGCSVLNARSATSIVAVYGRIYMISVTTVGPHDVQTKEGLFKDRGAVTLAMMARKDIGLYKCVFNVWPSNCMYEILDNYYNRISPLWLAPIDLGENVKLTPFQFMDMVGDQFKGKEFGYDEVLEYLKELLADEACIYKFMVKMENISKEEKKRY